MNQQEKITIGPGGEIISAEITTTKKVTAEEFVQVYLKDNEQFFDLSKPEYSTLSMLWLKSDYYKEDNYPGNKIVVNKQIKDEIIVKTKLAESTIKNALSSLVKKDIILKDDKYKGVYYLNPKYFFKGKVTDRTKCIKHYTSYYIGDVEPNK